MVLKRADLKNILLHIAIIVSVFSQIEPIARVIRPTMYAMWVLLIGYAVVRSGRRFYIAPFTKVFIVSYTLFIALCVLASLHDSVYLTANYLGMLRVPLLVTIVGDYYSTCSNKDEIQAYIKTYIGCAVLYAFWVQITYFPSYSAWLRSTQYTFMLKNSAAQIWASAIILILFLVEYKNRIGKIVGSVSGIYLLILCGISQCRTAILALAIVACMFALIRVKKKHIVIACILLLGVIAWKVPFTHQFIEQALFLNKYAGADLNTFSSGRLDRFADALADFVNSPIIGTGHNNVDCSYICILAESGIIGFVLIETIWMKKIVLNMKYSFDAKYAKVLFSMTIFYLVESLLERYPPFGPGVSSFMFWFLSAVFIGQANQKALVNTD